MEAMAILGNSTGQLGSGTGTLTHCNVRATFPSRNVACAQSFSSEQQGRLAALRPGRRGMEDEDPFAPRANLAISRLSDPEVAAERPKVFARFPDINDVAQDPSLIKACIVTETVVALSRNSAFIKSANVNEPVKIQKQEKVQFAAAVDESEESWGVQLAIAALKFYKREISPLLPGSCRYVPTCSDYSIQAYRTYGILKGTILTAWRLARCNPFGGSGFDPPRWFGEPKPPSSS